MKLTVCSDAHDNFGAFDLIKEDKPLFFCGDVYTNQKLIDLFFGTLFKFYLNKVDKEEVVKQFENNIEEIKKSIVEKEIPEFFKKNELFVLPGNHDDGGFYSKLTNLPNIKDLHIKKMNINGVEIIGYGGLFVPDERMKLDSFHWYSDREVADNLSGLNAKEGCIIIMHEMPLAKYCPETRKVIEEIKPRFVIGCHDHNGKEQIINGIRYINCGALVYNKFLRLDI